jgi:hypothetical protein
MELNMIRMPAQMMTWLEAMENLDNLKAKYLETSELMFKESHNTISRHILFYNQNI